MYNPFQTEVKLLLTMSTETSVGVNNASGSNGKITQTNSSILFVLVVFFCLSFAELVVSSIVINTTNGYYVANIYGAIVAVSLAVMSVFTYASSLILSSI